MMVLICLSVVWTRWMFILNLRMRNRLVTLSEHAQCCPFGWRNQLFLQDARQTGTTILLCPPFQEGWGTAGQRVHTSDRAVLSVLLPSVRSKLGTLNFSQINPEQVEEHPLQLPGTHETLSSKPGFFTCGNLKKGVCTCQGKATGDNLAKREISPTGFRQQSNPRPRSGFSHLLS